MQTVLVANRKGGVGKTMIAVTLAAAFANRGERVALADADRQQSARAWLGRRPGDAARIRSLDWSKSADIGEHPKKLDWLIIDAPGSLKGSKAEALIAHARAVLVPVQPSMFDENATRGFLADIEDIKRVQKGKASVLVIANRIRARSRAAATLGAFLDDVGHTPLTSLSERSAYGELAGMGLSIFDRQLAALKPIKEQWSPIFDMIEA